jgi:hypothetical protein
LENKALRRISGLKKEENDENCIMRSFMTLTPHLINFRVIKLTGFNEWHGGGGEGITKFWSENLRGGNHFEIYA